ncbi:MAG: 2-hydroxyacyl-CoA dehydratase [Deltaproteobacteria bacterium HGW-Deltaproteobacteria-22]|nr:MAG: 2-hydroxyacyl-CoA dehydratase [Deltaproteobacteria bacterium HGW-Deltaproteobacteria-22]
MTIFNEIRQLAQSTANDYLTRARHRGHPTVGYFCSYVPEEMIHAAGAVPYRMRAVGSEGTSLGDTYFSSANCSFVRRVLDKGLRGDFDFLDGIVFMNGCDHNRRLFDNWSYAHPDTGFNYMLFVPHGRSEACLAQYGNELAKLGRFLEERFDTELTAEKLWNSVALYNRKRALLQEIADSRRAAVVPISGTEFLSLMLAVSVVPVEDAIALLEQVLAELRAGRIHTGQAVLRLFVTGSCLEELSHLELLESAGAVVVADAICLGARYFELPVPVGGDPLAALGERYLRNLSCPRMMDDVAGRIAHVRERVSDFGADAVILEKLEFCSMMSGESYISSHELRKFDIPSITLTRELYGGGVGQLKTRIQAFYEKVINRS